MVNIKEKVQQARRNRADGGVTQAEVAGDVVTGQQAEAEWSSTDGAGKKKEAGAE